MKLHHIVRTVLPLCGIHLYVVDWHTSSMLLVAVDVCCVHWRRCAITLRRKLLDDHLSCCRTKQKGLVQVKPENLRWTPFVPSPHVQVRVNHTVITQITFLHS